MSIQPLQWGFVYDGTSSKEVAISKRQIWTIREEERGEGFALVRTVGHNGHARGLVSREACKVLAQTEYEAETQ